MTTDSGRNGPRCPMLSVGSSCAYVLWSGSLILHTLAEVSLPKKKVHLDVKEAPNDLLVTTSEEQ